MTHWKTCKPNIIIVGNKKLDIVFETVEYYSQRQ